MGSLSNAGSKIRALFHTVAGRIISYSMKFPLVRRRYWSRYYNQVGEFYRNDNFLFMNLGYASIDTGKEKPPEELDDIHRFSEKLYHHVTGGHDIRGKEVLEVGCGRGGGSAYIMRQFQPQKITAVDLAENAIKICRQVHKIPGIHFQQADATALPFADQSFDVVINIESSHCYPSRERFFAEVTRVLRPGGLFMYTDLAIFSHCQLTLDNLTLDQVKELLANCGLSMLKAEDISRNVLKARDLITDSNLFEEAIERSLKQDVKDKMNVAALMPFLKNSFWLRGTELYNLLHSGKVVYWSWILEKQA